MPNPIQKQKQQQLLKIIINMSVYSGILALSWSKIQLNFPSKWGIFVALLSNVGKNTLENDHKKALLTHRVQFSAVNGLSVYTLVSAGILALIVDGSVFRVRSTSS